MQTTDYYELLQVERGALIGLRDAGRIKLGTFRQIERDLDIEEQRLLRTTPVDTPTASGAGAVRG